MLPAAGSERLTALRGNERDLRPAFPRAHHAADACDGNACDTARHARGWRSGEEEFVILTSVEGLSQCCAGMDGQRRGFDFRGDG